MALYFTTFNGSFYVIKWVAGVGRIRYLFLSYSTLFRRPNINQRLTDYQSVYYINSHSSFVNNKHCLSAQFCVHFFRPLSSNFPLFAASSLMKEYSKHFHIQDWMMMMGFLGRQPFFVCVPSCEPHPSDGFFKTLIGLNVLLPQWHQTLYGVL